MEILEEDYKKIIDLKYNNPVYDIFKEAKVGIAGLGGLGSNIAVALARCGVGNLYLADFDRVELSNLNRQYYTVDDIGSLKTDAIKRILSKINPFCKVHTYPVRVTPDNALTLFKDCSIVCEAFDVPEAKAMLVDTILSYSKDKYIVASSGMAGFGKANDIHTRRVSNRFYLCGDEKTDLNVGDGLTASRVIICAGHQATKVLELIMDTKD